MEAFPRLDLPVRRLAALMIYGFLMDTSTVFMGMGAVHETAFLAAYLSGLPHEYHTWDCVRGISGYPGRADDAELDRIKKKYGYWSPDFQKQNNKDRDGRNEWNHIEKGRNPDGHRAQSKRQGSRWEGEKKRTRFSDREGAADWNRKV